MIEEEEGGFNHALPRAITGEPKTTMLAEWNDNVTFDLSRLSETNIDEVGDASDETWLLSISSTESSTVKAMLGAGDTSGARALRSSKKCRQGHLRELLRPGSFFTVIAA